MKFFVKSCYPTFSSSHPIDYQISWEFAGVGMEYLFIANGSQHQRQNTEGNDDFKYIKFNVLNIKSQPETKSGRYKENAVPK